MREAVRNKVVRMLVAAALFVLPVQVVAAPSNVVVVAKSGATYNNPITAINSITGATASNRYLVKIMPGEYDLGTNTLQMVPYIDVEGSGAENTVIVSSNTNGDVGICEVGTVQMANNSTIKNVKIVNNPTANSGMYSSALVFNNVTAKAEGISIQIGNDLVYSGGRNSGACIGTTSNATLNNVYIEAHNANGRSNTISMVDGSQLLLTNSKLVAVNPGYETDMIEAWTTDAWNLENGTIVVMNTNFIGTAPRIQAINVSGFNTFLKNAAITMHAGVNGYARVFYNYGADLKVSGTTFISDGLVTYLNNEGTAKIDSTLIPNNYSTLQNNSDVKFINNFDETYTAIPNQ